MNKLVYILLFEAKGLLIMLYNLILFCLTLKDHAVTEQIVIDLSWSVSVICMLSSCCLLIGIEKMLMRWHLNCFEFYV